MIDEKTLAEDEREQKMLADHYANKPEMVVMFKKRIAVIRNARRYLELKKQFAPFSMDVDGNHSWCWRGNPSRMKGPTLDAAADRLLEGRE